MRLFFKKIWHRFRPVSHVKRIAKLEGTMLTLSNRYDTISQDLIKLEAKEQLLLYQGRRASDLSAKRRIAGTIRLLRRDINRMRTVANVVSQQMTLICAHG